jgi:hypothetical protein
MRQKTIKIRTCVDIPLHCCLVQCSIHHYVAAMILEDDVVGRKFTYDEDVVKKVLAKTTQDFFYKDIFFCILSVQAVQYR